MGLLKSSHSSISKYTEHWGKDVCSHLKTSLAQSYRLPCFSVAFISTQAYLSSKRSGPWIAASVIPTTSQRGTVMKETTHHFWRHCFSCTIIAMPVLLTLLLRTGVAQAASLKSCQPSWKVVGSDDIGLGAYYRKIASVEPLRFQTQRRSLLWEHPSIHRMILPTPWFIYTRASGDAQQQARRTMSGQ